MHLTQGEPLMSKDDRLYARFDIAMDEHPKIMLLSDVGFRALVEATLYSRRQLTDGFIAARIAERKWGRVAIDELTGNDPERPSWHPHIKDGVDGYMIHDFAEHQTTNADIEAKRAAGRKGGLAKAAKTGSTLLAPATDLLEQKASTTSSAPLAITEKETETETTSLSTDGGPDNTVRSPYSAPFLDWWKTYPRKESKGDAWKAWEQLRKARQLPAPDDLKAATSSYAARVDPGFVKMPGGWLRDRKWEDEVTRTTTARPSEFDWMNA